MHEEKLSCKYCGSSKIVRDNKLDSAIVQEINTETNEPIGKPTTYYAFKCLRCGQAIYLNKYKAPDQLNFS
jgi:predicted RNA-binding Zn-ribbon protein involved in translation (DUF1610 family)